MSGWRRHIAVLAAVGSALAAVAAGAQPAPAPTREGPPAPAPVLEPRAIDVLKASSAKLAGARTLSFVALASYESPSRLGPSLLYSTLSRVTFQRPDKLRVVVPGDGPRSEFYYDGKTMTAYEPEAKLVAIGPAPPDIDRALEAAFRTNGTYFPFADVLVADPYADIANELELAFYIGQSDVVGGVRTDMVAYASHGVFVQAWIGAVDKLPRRARAVYRDDPLRLRHQVDFSGWQLNQPVPAGTFTPPRALAAKRIPFAHPDPGPPPAPSAPNAPAGK